MGGWRATDSWSPCTSYWPFYSIVYLDELLMDPLEGSSTSLLPSVPGPRQSSRRHIGESLLRYDSDTSVNGGLRPSRSRSPHTPPASRRARGGRARRGRAGGRGGPCSSDSSEPPSPPSSDDDASSCSSSSSDDEDSGGKRCPHPRTWGDTILCQKWHKREPDSTVFPFAGPQPGPRVPVTRTTTASQLFDRFFTAEVWALIIEESNRHARVLNLAKWVDITLPEIRAFIGLLLVMGILRLPRLELYWTNQYPLIYTKVREVMTKDRFLAILRALHLNDSSLQVSIGQPGYDPLFKVRKLLDLVTPRFEDQFNLHEWVSIDEAMIPFKGRLSFKQYMKDKPTKWGIKVFVLADAETGYTKRIQIYTGKNQNITTAMDGGLTTSVVLGLMDGLEEDHIKLFVDNYYTSPTLFMELYNRKVNACGTARANRTHYPKRLQIVKGKRKVKLGLKVRKKHRETTYKKVNRGYISHRASGPLLAQVWVDKRVCGPVQRRYDACHEMLTQLAIFCIDSNTKKGTRVSIS